MTLTARQRAMAICAANDEVYEPYYVMEGAHFNDQITGDIQRGIENYELHAIVSEDTGGIIGFAYGDENAEQILRALLALDAKETA